MAIMTLAVYAYTRKSDGYIQTIETDHPKTLAGFERCRYELWGADVMILLGLKLLPSLKINDVYAEADALNELEHEIKTILENISLISEHTDFDKEYIIFRVQNIFDAIETAKNIGGGVYIG